MARVTLRITGTQLLCQDEHPSLLAALESHNVAVEYQCREGYCGSCRTRLVAGQVD
ncbi:ferredoxin-like diferric-tyrosyl radical cofactor maintenance protein YfaE, partial [Shigella sonnei]